ncbi:MAG: FAD-dependent monooxygenase, partial [Phycisphaerales bacterium]|nr:FAD-dependent monooxygenase [Phycisphaerales bacterium]
MTNIDGSRVIIVGAGLGGALLACRLGQRGVQVEVYERRPDPRRAGFVGGRSINLALSTRGLTALRRVGLADAVLADAIPMRGRMMHAPDGRLTYQAYSKNRDDAIQSVSRGGLNVTLLDAAEACDSVRLFFGHRCEEVDLDRPAVTFIDEASDATVLAEGDLVVGADGAYSAVRTRLQRTDRFEYAQSYLAHGYKEVSFPPVDGEFALEPNALHIWPRGGYMMIALPNPDRSFTGTLFWPYTGPHGFDALQTPDQIRAYFSSQFPDAVPLLPRLVEEYQSNPTGSLVTIRCDPWHYEDRVVLIGDAAHAIVPFYGQGMNAAFEDCSVLDECLDRRGATWGSVLAEYSASRKENGDAIAELAMENFIEMRDRVSSPLFLLRKRVEHTLHRWFPRWFVPLYNMVTFTNIP